MERPRRKCVNQWVPPAGEDGRKWLSHADGSIEGIYMVDPNDTEVVRRIVCALDGHCNGLVQVDGVAGETLCFSAAGKRQVLVTMTVGDQEVEDGELPEIKHGPCKGCCKGSKGGAILGRQFVTIPGFYWFSRPIKDFKPTADLDSEGEGWTLTGRLTEVEQDQIAQSYTAAEQFNLVFPHETRGWAYLKLDDWGEGIAQFGHEWTYAMENSLRADSCRPDTNGAKATPQDMGDAQRLAGNGDALADRFMSVLQLGSVASQHQAIEDNLDALGVVSPLTYNNLVEVNISQSGTPKDKVATIVRVLRRATVHAKTVCDAAKALSYGADAGDVFGSPMQLTPGMSSTATTSALADLLGQVQANGSAKKANDTGNVDGSLMAALWLRRRWQKGQALRCVEGW